MYSTGNYLKSKKFEIISIFDTKQVNTTANIIPGSI